MEMYELLGKVASWTGISVCVLIVSLLAGQFLTSCSARNHCHETGVREVGFMSVICNPPAASE